MTTRAEVLRRVITANARRIAPVPPTMAPKALVAPTLPATTREAAATPPVPYSAPDYDTASDDEWNSHVIRRM